MNYEELGFKCGIEIHQQLDTETKLFCDCPVETPEADAWTEEYSRYLRSVAGESGEEDEAARLESENRTEYVYRHFDSCSCLVELDEEPPHPLNQEALDAALAFSRLVDAEIPDEIQVMRKIVVDGSNTTGFQRTSMVGFNGEVETETGTVGIEDIELEEESAGIVKRDDDRAVYRLDRLGIPLVEVGTDATIQSPQHAKEIAAELGMLLRSTRRARRGLGTIRQDVNVSIEEGSRVEIKGFQDLDRIDELVEKEVERQKSLVELANSFSGEPRIEDASQVLEDSDSQIVGSVLESGGAAVAVVLPGLDGELNTETSGSRRLVEELVDYATSRGVNGLIHTDEDLEDYGLEDEFDRLRSHLELAEQDAIAVVAADKDTAESAAEAVKERAEMLYAGEVPEETRQGEDDATTSYLRPLPGAARMYPETDIPPVRVPEERVEEIDGDLPETLDELEERYSEEIGQELASQIVSSRHLSEFERFRDLCDSRTVANVFVNVLPGLEADGVQTDALTENHFRTAFEASGDQVGSGELPELLRQMTGSDPEEALDEFLDSRSSEDEIREVVDEVVDENEEMVEEQGMRSQGALMGEVMQRVDAPGDEVSSVLRDVIQRELSK